MSKADQLQRWAWIIEKLRRKPCSREELEQYLMVKGVTTMNSRRTFTRDLEAIREKFGIDVSYNASENLYSINNNHQPLICNRLLEVIELQRMLSTAQTLSPYVSFERRHAPGTEYLHPLLDAIETRRVVRFFYTKFWDDVETRRVVEPYALKEFRNRWYLIANEPASECIKTFALDRMTVVEATNRRFVYPENFTLENHFLNCFGIIAAGDEPAQDIILSFTAEQGKYIRSMPLHASQTILTEDTTELRIGLKLAVTYDFIMEILSHGDDVRVIAPASLRQRILQISIKMAALNE